MTAKTDKGTTVSIGRKEYWEIGLDGDGDHRLGAWQIKEVLDLSLQPLKTTKEQFVTGLPPDTKSAELEIKVTFYPSGTSGKALEIHKVIRQLNFN